MSEEETIEVQDERLHEPESATIGSAGDDPELRERIDAILDAALERNAHEPVALDIGELTSYASVLFVTNGTSDRQVRGIAENIIKRLKERGEQPLGVEGMNEGRWVLIDANDIIVHVFDHDSRAMFNLESLWGDAPRIELAIPSSRDGDAPTPETRPE